MKPRRERMPVSIPVRAMLTVALVCSLMSLTCDSLRAADETLRVGAAAVNLKSDKSMPIAGGIEARFTDEQEGELRVVAVVIDRLDPKAKAPIADKLAIVACDVLWITRGMYDDAVTQIHELTGIVPENILVNATHTHHAPSTAPAHDFGVSPEFAAQVGRSIVEAVNQANSKLEGGECQFYFHLGEEKTIGANSRLKLPDGNITWLNPQREAGNNPVPTGPFDPQLPVFDFRTKEGKTRALIYNHSTHTIGTKSGKNVRSPGFYGLAAQELEQELGGVVSFLEGASGSTHNIAQVPVAEAIVRLKGAVLDARAKAQPRPVKHLAALRRALKFRVRRFDDAEEDAKIARYTTKYAPQGSDLIRKVFSNMRQKLNDQQGQERETWVQAMVIGDIAIVGVPAEYFTKLGVDIKSRSPFKYTYVAELANDWIGYLPDREGHELGGYQTWMGLHSYAEPGTGERVADEAVAMLKELAGTGATQSDAELQPNPQQEKPREALAPNDEHKTIHLADADLKIELVASEPDIVSPVAIAWDADKRMYVAEMIGYPTTETSGRISRLEDRDHDGQYEHAIVFAEGLNFPTSVMPYRDGLLVTDAPDILFLKDTNGDGKADERRVEWTGFGTGSQQLRANALHWGLDNWIYGANGRCDGEIRRPDAPNEPAISIRTRDFRFDPVAKKFEAIVGQSQFGQAQDDWGDRFLSWNTIPVRHVAIPDQYLASSPDLNSQAVVDTTDPQDTGEVFPISPPPKQFNSERANYYNAMCGLTILRGDALGTKYRGNAFVGESLTNLVTRRVLEPSGPTYVAVRKESGKEFLASSDSWFHPVFMTNGPDGALYIVDFYRELVEHPIYVASTEIRAQVDWRHGFDHGRIWRVSHRDFHPADSKSGRLSGKITMSELVQSLSSSSGWRRDAAQRLLVERQDQTAVELLRRTLSESESPFARLHALWTLDGLHALGDADLNIALADSHPRVLENALRLSAPRLQTSNELRTAARALAGDSDDRVQFQLALAFGGLDSDLALPILALLVKKSKADRWISSAVLSGNSTRVDLLLKQLAATTARSWFVSPSDAQRTFLLNAGKVLGARTTPNRLFDSFLFFFQVISFRGANEKFGEGTLALFFGISSSANDRGISLRKLFKDQTGEKVTLIASLDAAVDDSFPLVSSADLSAEHRAAAVEFLREGERSRVAGKVLQLLTSAQPPVVQRSVARVIASFEDPELCGKQYENWGRSSQSARRAVLQAAATSQQAAMALATALENGTVSPAEIPIELEGTFKSLKHPGLTERFAKVMGASASSDRKAVVEQYKSALSLTGDVMRGAGVFRQNCLNCHTIQRFGKQIGPDLTAVSSRPPETILADILDPSARVSNDFLVYMVVTNEGKTATGLMTDETAGTFALKTAEDQKINVTLADVAEMRATGKSLMPEGVEKKVDPQAMADLLAFLRQPRRELLMTGAP